MKTESESIGERLIAANQSIKEKEFWLAQLADLPEKIGFPYDHQSSGSPESLYKEVKFQFHQDVSARLLAISNQSDLRLHNILMAGFVLLLNKYNHGNPMDITVASPIDKQEVEGEFINTLLLIRNRLEKNMTFKELLLQVSRTILAATENQNFPVELLPSFLNIPYARGEHFPLFDAAILLENIHQEKDIRPFLCHVVIAFLRTENGLLGTVRYNANLYHDTSIVTIAAHFESLLRDALFHIDAPIATLQVLTQEEKQQLLAHFNTTLSDYPMEQTIHRWFAEQAAKTPAHIAVASPVALDHLYNWLTSATTALTLDKSLENFCFRKNPFIYHASLPVAHAHSPWIVLKTHRHNSVIVNPNMKRLLDLFDGQRNLKTIYLGFKSLQEQKNAPKNTTAGHMEFLIYTMKPGDLLEIAFQFNPRPEVFSTAADPAQNFAQLMRTLYRHHLIQCVGIQFKETSLDRSLWDTFDENTPPSLQAEINIEDAIIKHKELSTAQVLLLGDTPGVPSTGLLYLAAYLQKNGVKTYCQFFDATSDYTSMKREIEHLLHKIRPRIVAISLKWFLYIARVMDMGRIIKAYAAQESMDIQIVIGGNTASYYSDNLMAYDFIDYLIQGDGEEPLLKLIQGENPAQIPNCIYRENGNIVRNPMTYIHQESNTAEIYLSHLDEILISTHAPRFGTFFIYTHKGCSMNCLYCGGCNQAQRKSFNRTKVLRRGTEEVRKDLKEALPYVSTFQFDFDTPDKNLQEYCRQIWDGIDLSNHFCIFATLTYPSPALIALVSQTFKYVYWDFDICTFSQRHRTQLVSLGLVKPQPSDQEILDFMARVEQYPNMEVRLNSITGLPYFKLEDIEPGEKLLAKIINTYSCFGELHWARLHAQPGAPILENTAQYQMYSSASSFEDFLNKSRENFSAATLYKAVEDLAYPYIYFHDDHLNSKITGFYLESNKKVAQRAQDRERNVWLCDTLTYQELDEKATRLAHQLHAIGVQPGDIVGLMLERSNHIPLGILGILKAGCAYLPIDPEFPKGRVDYMLADSQAAALITTSGLTLEPHPGAKWQRKIFFIDTLPHHQSQQEITAADPATPPNEPHRSRSADNVYVIYTSGTTGKPKGVLLTHQNLVNYVRWFSHRVHLTPADKTVLTSSFAFDLGYTSLYPVLLNGGQLHILPRESYLLAERLLDYIKQQSITYLKMTPSLFSVMANAPGFSQMTCQSLRLALVGGEAINVRDIEKAHAQCPHLKIMNHYGPTEATVGCVATEIDFDTFPAFQQAPVIGKPIANTQVYVLNSDLQLLPIGVPGELCVAGAGLAAGYLNQPQLTSEKFLPFSPPAPGPQQLTLYKTGDLARWLPNGTIQFLGRIDNQVKVRGYRIELGEIENRLHLHPLIKEAVVVVKEPASKDSPAPGDLKYLCAYIVPNNKIAPPPSHATGEPLLVTYQELWKTDAIAQLEQLAQNAPTQIALTSGELSLNYASLNRYADALAHTISTRYDDRYKLSSRERTRYKRQMLLHGWGTASQEKLKSTTVFVAGAGGGASPTIIQLALVGIGTIKVCDFDTVELSNLNRQFLHDEERLDMNKALSAQLTVSKTNPHVKVIPYTQKLTRENISEIVGDVDIIYDMFDGPADKFVLSEYAVARGIPHVIISMTDINAYTAILHTPQTPCYHCMFDKKKLETIVSGMQNYVEKYSKNPLPVVATSLFISTGIAVNETLKILLGFKSPAYNKFFYFNQRGEDENLAYTAGYKAMTHLFSDHFQQLCRQQGFDWDIGWRGNCLEELTITPDPHCPVCSTSARQKLSSPAMPVKNESLPLLVPDTQEQEVRAQSVALLLDPGLNMAMAFLGVLKSRKTLVPLDPQATRDKLHDILEHSESRVIITQNQHLVLAEKLREKLNTNIKIINLDTWLEESHTPPTLPQAPGLPEHIACMLYSPGFNLDIKEFFHTLLSGQQPYVFSSQTPETAPTSLSQVLRTYLLQELPDYMIPSYFIPLAQMPLTSNGKLDRKALPDPQLSVEKHHTPPGNQMEHKMAEIWADVLGIEKDIIGMDSNFFDLGGHSLNATIMVAKVHKNLNARLALGDVFKTPTLKGLAQLIKTEDETLFAAIAPVEKKEYYPLSSAQLRMFLLHQMKGHDTSDNTPWAVVLEGRLDLPRLQDTFNLLIQRHEVIRTSFEMIQHQPVQRVHENLQIHIQHLEFDPPTPDPTPLHIKNTLHRFVQPFDLGQAPLLRAGILEISPQKHILIYDMHHIITDGVSLQIFTADFIQLYSGQPLDPLPIQYKDFATWQHERMESGVLKKQEEYWLEVFKGDIPTLHLPTDYPRPALQSFEGQTLHFVFEAPLTTLLREIASSHQATLHIVLFTIYNILLHKYTGQEDIIVGTSSAGRPHSDLHPVIGFFINTLPMRNYPSPEKSFLQLLQEIRDNSIKALDNQDYQFDNLVARLAIPRDPSRQPLFDTNFTLQNQNVQAKNTAATQSNTTLKNYTLAENISKFDLNITAYEENGAVYFSLQYGTKLFKPETIQRFIDYFKNITRECTSNPQKKLIQIEMIGPEEKNRLLFNFNATQADYPTHKTIVHLFQEQVDRTPDHIAVTGESPTSTPIHSCQISYRLLDQSATRLAHRLIEKGVGPDTIVALTMDRAIEMIIAIMAILKAGAAYLPIDTLAPEERVKFILADSHAKLVLTPQFFIETSPGMPLVPTALPSRTNDLAYVIYTSGTTGKPKGVMIPHRSLVNLCLWHNRQYQVTHQDHATQYANLAFDASVWEIFPYLICGASLYLIADEIKLDSPQLNRYFTRHDISICFLPTPICEQYLLIEQDNSPLRVLLTGGDKLRLARKKNYRFYNNYGPTENTVVSSFYPVTNDHLENIPIGKPIDNCQIYILHKNSWIPAPIGITGELYLGGAGLAVGYLNNPDFTHHSFIPNPFVKGERIFRTGDMAQWLPDGNILFIGRGDNQVKIRGFRIELGEIEKCLTSVNSIKEAIVIDRENSGKEKYLCAYFVADQEIPVTQIKNILSKKLPEYMIPAFFVQLDQFPLTPNGKIDVRALPEPLIQAGNNYAPPRNPVEEKLVAIFADVLSIESHAISIQNNFFQLGGHSLKAASLVSKIHAIFDVKIPLAEVFKKPTISQLAEYIKENNKELFFSIPPTEEKEYYPQSPAQKRLYILQQFNVDNTNYNMPLVINLQGITDKNKLESVFLKLIARHESFRTTFDLIHEVPCQIIHKEVDFAIREHHVNQEEAKKLISAFAIPFDLKQAPLLRVDLLTIGANRQILLLDMHHIITDGLSQGILQKEFILLYKDQELTPLTLQYKDYSVWLHTSPVKESMHQQEIYWLNQLEQEIKVIDLPTDFLRPTLQSLEGRTVNFILGEAESSALKHLALENGVTSFMVLLSIFNILLAKLSGQEDIIVGVDIQGRRHEDLQNIIGMFVNTMPLRNFPASEKTFMAFLNQVKDRTLDAFENQDFPFEELVEKVTVARDPSRNPIFDVMFSHLEYENTATQATSDSQNLTYENKTAKFDLTLNATESSQNFFLAFEFCTTLFHVETIHRFFRYFKLIVAAVLTNPHQKISALQIISDEEREQVLFAFNHTRTPLSMDKTFIQLFLDHVSQHPHKIAATYNHHQITYHELNRQSTHICSHLQPFGVTANQPVPLYLKRSIAMLASIIGVFKAGGAYVPIEVDYPPSRIEFILENTGARVTITEDQSLPVLQTIVLPATATPTLKSMGILSLHPEQPLDATGDPIAHPSPPSGMQDLVYIIYTSGTTGKPKGVMIHQLGMINHLYAKISDLGIAPTDILAQTAPACFDISVWQFLAALLQGGVTAIIDKEVVLDGPTFLKIIQKKQVTILETVPSLMTAFLEMTGNEANKALPQLRWMIPTGEPLTILQAREWFRHYPHIQLVNAYGPTEASDDITHYKLDKAMAETLTAIPIGKPLQNLHIYILDKDLTLCPVGVRGEICVAGLGVGKGYWQDIEKTKNAFIPNPLIPQIKEKEYTMIYKTGDIGYFLPDGNILCLGRKDFQVKIRGNRVELGEIESRLLTHQTIKEAVVINRTADTGEIYLCAYIVPQAPLDSFHLDPLALQTFLSQFMPDYMIPAYFVPMDKIPLSQAGKIDRKALPAPEVNAGAEYVAPHDEVEEKLSRIWATVLGLEQNLISVNANFFQLGGHSLKATIMAAKIHKEFNVKVSIGEIFSTPTIEKIAALIQVILWAQQNKEILPTNPNMEEIVL